VHRQPDSSQLHCFQANTTSVESNCSYLTWAHKDKQTEINNKLKISVDDSPEKQAEKKYLSENQHSLNVDLDKLTRPVSEWPPIEPILTHYNDTEQPVSDHNCERIKEVVAKFLWIPYKNNYKQHNHEDELCNILEGFGFKAYTTIKNRQDKIAIPKNWQGDGIKITQAQVDSWISDPSNCTMANGTFLDQPFGDNGSPDFLVKINDDFILPIEAKSTKTANNPKYNNTIPKKNYLYVFCNQSKIGVLGKLGDIPKGETTIYLGYDILTDLQRILLLEHSKQAKINDIKINEIYSRI